MSGMKPWEREIIEYRPSIGLDTTILSIVQTKQANADPVEAPIKKFELTPVVSAATKVLGIDILENLIASLSRANALLAQLDESLSHDVTYISYQKAVKDGDFIGANQIYLNNLGNINGNPDFDIYPMLSDLPNEIETYLNFLNQELFDGEADYSDLTIIRNQEEQQVAQLVQIESEDLKTTDSIVLTPEQRHVIQKMIDEGAIIANSVDDYIQDLIQEQLQTGSSRINYEEITNRVQVIATGSEKSSMYKDMIDNMDTYVNTHLNEYVGEDLKGSLNYVVDLAGSQVDAKDSFQQLYNHHVSQTKRAYINQKRVANREVREFLDQKLSSVKSQKGFISKRVQSLLQEDKYADSGAQMMMSALSDSMGASTASWKFILTEHIGTTRMNVTQSDTFFQTLNEKRKTQTFYKFTDLVGREYTGTNQDDDLNQFISYYDLHDLS
jgi:hypothetical protein